MTVNGKSVNLGGYNNNYKDDAWSANYTLEEGENVFTVVATNENGKQTTKSITVTFEAGEPKIQFINCKITGYSKGLSYEWGGRFNADELTWDGCTKKKGS